MTTREFTPGEIKSKINVYLDDKLITPLIATKICMSDVPGETVEGWIDLVELERNEDGTIKYTEDGKPVFKAANLELVEEIREANKLAQQLDIKPITENPMPEIKRYSGQIRWELANKV